MPAATKDHRSKKSSQGHEAWRRRKQEAGINGTAMQFQRLWRIACLRDRMARGEFSEKNQAELTRLDASYAVKRS